LKPRLALLTATCLLLAAGGYYGWLHWLAPEDATKNVLTAVVSQGDLEDTITATG
jgi:multidrug efflux pump subunit AcrA (membrane-fusion protein)